MLVERFELGLFMRFPVTRRHRQQTGVAHDAAQAGVDGVLVTDLVPEEAEEFSALLRAARLDMIFLVAPTSTDQLMLARSVAR